MTAPSSKPATSITIDGVDFGAIVETASDSSKNSTCIWSIGHHNNTIFLDVKDPNHPGLPSARSVIVKRDSIAHKKYNITIYYLGRPVDPALLFTASSIAQFNNPYTPHQIKEILPVVLRAVERSPVCTGVFVNSPHYESLRASFHKSYHNMFSDWKTGDQRVIVCTAPITHAGVVYDATFRDLGCGRVVATKDGWMCTACKSLANTMGQRVIRQDLQRPTDGNNGPELPVLDTTPCCGLHHVSSHITQI
ncbi:hypothetical protein BCR44DRAFT_224063 [Catenaria anguillulae PL171]|uniref:Uncharacterized protein n=1 Tax=Catenaria anguillulae PL171 TaxID=765915 RepID=A0A1Y2H987_9FUNG|nr:hypothetical protein BCR44DRAFT_224063 [Catenaria anguillulae PL171]